jgi:hypothetical protein
MLDDMGEGIRKDLDRLIAASFEDAQGQYIPIRDAYAKAYNW